MGEVVVLVLVGVEGVGAGPRTGQVCRRGANPIEPRRKLLMHHLGILHLVLHHHWQDHIQHPRQDLGPAVMRRRRETVATTLAQREENYLAHDPIYHNIP